MATRTLGKLRVLLADDNQEPIAAVLQRLREAGVEHIVTLEPGAGLVDVVKTVAPDVIIVDMSRPDRDSLESIREVSDHAPRPIVLSVEKDDASFMEEAIEAGISSYNLLGSSIPDVKPIVQAAVAIFRRYRVSDPTGCFEIKSNQAGSDPNSGKSSLWFAMFSKACQRHRTPLWCSSPEAGCGCPRAYCDGRRRRTVSFPYLFA